MFHCIVQQWTVSVRNCPLSTTIAQAMEQQEAQEEQRVQSITEIMKNPSKVILLKVQ